MNINDDLGAIDRLAVFKPQGSLVKRQLQFIITAAYAAQVVELSWINKESFSDVNNYYFIGKATHPIIYEAEQLAGESAYSKILKQYLGKMKQNGVPIDLFQGEDLYDSVISAAELINTHVEKSDAGITYYVLVVLNKRSEKTTLDFYSYLFNQSVTAPSADISTINVDQVVDRIMMEVQSMNKGYRRKAFK